MTTILTDTAAGATPLSAIWGPETTVADLLERLGGIPPQRVRMVPMPGTATEKDLLAVHDRTDRICELIDGTLVEKPMGFLESRVAMRLGHHLESYLDRHKLGIVVGEAGFLRLFPGQVRAPDLTFIRRERLPGGRTPHEPIPALVPDLAVEVLSESNTPREMERKLREYFAAGTRLVWYIDPKSRTARTFTTPEQSTLLAADGVLNGGDLLPGFELPLGQLLAEAEGEV